MATALGYGRESFLSKKEDLFHKNGLQDSKLSRHIYHEFLIAGLLMPSELALLSASSSRLGLTSSPEERTAAVMFELHNPSC